MVATEKERKKKRERESEGVSAHNTGDTHRSLCDLRVVNEEDDRNSGDAYSTEGDGGAGGHGGEERQTRCGVIKERKSTD